MTEVGIALCAFIVGVIFGAACLLGCMLWWVDE